MKEMPSNFGKLAAFVSGPFLLVLATVICLHIYWPGLHGSFLLDDQDNLGYLLQPNLTYKDYVAHLLSTSGQFGRPVAMLSFTANALLSQNVFYWKLTNLIIHLVCGVLIYRLAQYLIYFAKPGRHRDKPSLHARAVSLIWLLHPVHVSTVLYTIQRMTQLSTLFILAAMLCYLIARKRQLSSEPFLGFQVLTWCVFFPLSIFSKENGLLFPLFVTLFELFLIQKDRITSKQIGLILLGGGIAALALGIYKADYLIAGFGGRNFTLQERVLTESRVVMAYIGMLIIPTQKNMGFVHDDFTLSTGLFEPLTTALSISAIALLVALAFYFRKKQPLLSVGILFFFTGHLMESTIFPLELMFEHRNYLPSLGIFLALTALVSTALEKNFCRGLSFLFLSLLTFSTWLRADSWSSQERLFYDLERHHPGSERIAAVLSEQAAQFGNYQRARDKLENFHTPGSDIKRLYIDCLEHKSLSDNQLKTKGTPSILIDNFAVMGIVDIANLGLDDKCSFSSSSFINWLDTLLFQKISTNSNRQMVMMYKAHYLWRSKQNSQAIAFLNDTFAINSKNPTPLFLACEWSLDENLPISREICPKAFEAASNIPYTYDEMTARVKKRYINYTKAYPG